MSTTHHCTAIIRVLIPTKGEKSNLLNPHGFCDVLTHLGHLHCIQALYKKLNYNFGPQYIFYLVKYHRYSVECSTL